MVRDPLRRFLRSTRPVVSALLCSSLGAIISAGCGEPEPARVFEVPEGASPQEVMPGEPPKRPEYRSSSGLPGPPPANPYEVSREVQSK